MIWKWALLVGGVVMPWVLMGRAIMMGFRERGLQADRGVWFGIAIPCTAIMFALFWLQELFFKR